MKKYICYFGTALFLCASVYFGSAVFFKFFFNSFLIKTPNLNGLSFEDAQSALKKGNLSLKKSGEDFSTFPAGKIYSQLPKAGSKIKEGRLIRVWVSKGQKQIKVPDLSGMDLFDARILAENKGIVIKHISYTKKNSAYNKVITSDPAPGTLLTDTNLVSLLVSIPEDDNSIVMPDLLGLEFRDARSLIKENRLVLGKTEYIDNFDFESDIIIDVSVPEGEKVKPGTIINLIISR